MSLRGIVFHWEPPYQDIYSGMDPYADAWTQLGAAFGLELCAVAGAFPFLARHGVLVVRELGEFTAAHPDAAFALATAPPHVGEPMGATTLEGIDYLIFGPSMGGPAWGGATWTYSPSPPGGFHALHLAHIAAHIARND